jgi:hypothetical protein
LQKLANDTGLVISVSHLPLGTSKWNKIEQRLYSHISQYWRGKPFLSHEAIVNLISSAPARSGLTAKYEIDTNNYVKRIRVADGELRQVNIIRDEFHGEWNYTIHPNNS